MMNTTIYATTYGDKTFYTDREEAINSTMANIPEEIKRDIFFHNNMVSQEEMFSLIFNKDEEKVEELKNWLEELIEEEFITEYDLEDIEEIFEDCSESDKKELLEIQKKFK